MADRARALVPRLREGDAVTLGRLVNHARIASGSICINLDGAALASDLEVTEDALAPASLILDSPFELRRRGVEARIVTGASAPAPDPTLIRMLARAHRWAGDLRAGETFAAIAAREGCSEAYIRSRVQIAFLSPKIQSMIIDGRQPTDLTLERLVRGGAPLDWDAQARVFGFGVRNPHSL